MSRTSAHLIGLAACASALAILPRGIALEVTRPVELLVGLVLAALALGVGLAGGRRAAPGAAGWALVALVLWAALRLPAGSDALLARERLGCLALATAALLTARGALAGAGPRAERALVAWLVLAATAVAAVGLLGLAGLGPRLPGVDAGAATFGTRNLAAGFVALAVPLALPRAGARRRLLAWTPAGVLLGYLALSGNRLAPLAAGAAVLALVTGAAWRGGGARARIGAACLVAVLAAVAWPHLPAAGSQTVAERLHLARVTAGMVAERPVVGLGTGQWAVAYPDAAAGEAARLVEPSRLDGLHRELPTVRGFRQPAHAHQDVLQVAAELGLPGAALLLLALCAGLGGLLRPARAGGTERRAAAGVLAFGLLGLGSFPLHSPPCALALGVLLALALPRAGRASTDVARARCTGRVGRTVHVARLAPAAALSLLCALLAGDAVPRVAAEGELARGVRAAERGDAKAALSALFRAEALCPDDVRAPRCRAWLHATVREDGAGRAAAERALALRPHDPGALNDLALCLRREGDAARAEALLRRARALLPGDPHVNVNLGAVLVARGATSEARRCFGVAVAENPNIFPAWEGLADCALLEGRALEALHLLEEAREARLRCGLALAPPPSPREPPS